MLSIGIRLLIWNCWIGSTAWFYRRRARGSGSSAGLSSRRSGLVPSEHGACNDPRGTHHIEHARGKAEQEKYNEPPGRNAEPAVDQPAEAGTDHARLQRVRSRAGSPWRSRMQSSPDPHQDHRKAGAARSRAYRDLRRAAGVSRRERPHRFAACRARRCRARRSCFRHSRLAAIAARPPPESRADHTDVSSAKSRNRQLDPNALKYNDILADFRSLGEAHLCAAKPCTAQGHLRSSTCETLPVAGPPRSLQLSAIVTVAGGDHDLQGFVPSSIAGSV